jgi:hypothetical protein
MPYLGNTALNPIYHSHHLLNHHIFHQHHQEKVGWALDLHWAISSLPPDLGLLIRIVQ